ncbi:MAG: aminotransferase class V-fold PLP-dependent enzyme [Gemmatimonadota bacterium]|nr:MAG: aminotransferase class V-fold PLP-dependent enzyme [Gemmatimonadota bacterium]
MDEMMDPSRLDFDFLRSQIVGVDATFSTPFGERPLVYCDYAASGRCLRFVESYLMRIERGYANTHTEDDVTGRSMTHLLHEAEDEIKRCVNAGPRGRIIACGTGSTGAIWKFQQLLGVALPPATRRLLFSACEKFLGDGKAGALHDFLRDRQPVVFVGPYEHHSNEVTWREGLATVCEVRLADDGGIDLDHLAELLGQHAEPGRLLIGSFSAASNVTGRLTPVHRLARLLHHHGALACFDYAASAPYVEIDMNPEPGAEGGDPSLDAIFISAHKFLGGPGSSGILVFNERVYHHDLAPSVGAGGTVAYVSRESHDFLDDIEAREKAGTPGVLQTMRAALAFMVKRAIGVDRIEARERDLLRRAMDRWRQIPAIEILGNPDPELRMAIISFNIRDQGDAYLHPKFVTTLLNDLFGIQSRAGCSCAAPYGHALLDIHREASLRYRDWVLKGYEGIKPGWCRIGFHYVMDDAEANYVIDAVEFVARRGRLFLPQYEFDMRAGHWAHRDEAEPADRFSLEEALHNQVRCPTGAKVRVSLYSRCLDEAKELADQLEPLGVENEAASMVFEGELGELQYFTCPAQAHPSRPLDPPAPSVDVRDGAVPPGEQRPRT